MFSGEKLVAASRVQRLKAAEHPGIFPCPFLSAFYISNSERVLPICLTLCLLSSDLKRSNGEARALQLHSVLLIGFVSLGKGTELSLCFHLQNRINNNHFAEQLGGLEIIYLENWFSSCIGVWCIL